MTESKSRYNKLGFRSKEMKGDDRKHSRYMQWLRTLKCIVCGSISVECHHLRRHEYVPVRLCGGVSIKPYDLCCLPLCHQHHEEIEKDYAAFEEKYRIDLRKELISHLIQYIQEKEL